MRGKPGYPKITLTPFTQKMPTNPIVVNLTRAIIKVKSVRHHLLEKDYGYIRVSQFQERTVAALNEAAQALVKETKARSKASSSTCATTQAACSMGAVGVSAAFLQPDVTVVSTKGRNKKRRLILKANCRRLHHHQRQRPVGRIACRAENHSYDRPD